MSVLAALELFSFCKIFKISYPNHLKQGWKLIQIMHCKKNNFGENRCLQNDAFKKNKKNTQQEIVGDLLQGIGLQSHGTVRKDSRTLLYSHMEFLFCRTLLC